MLKTIIISIIAIIALTSCQNRINPIISEIDIDGSIMQVINYEKIKDSSQIKLTDLATDLHIVPLETHEECMLNLANYYVYDRYILAFQHSNRVLQFDKDGKFIRQICSQGKGPHEFQDYNMIIRAIDENNDILYITDAVKSYIMSWDLNTGSYRGDIKRTYSGKIKNMFFTAKGTIILSPMLSDSEAGKFYLWEQDLEGNLIKAVEAPKTDSYVDSQDKLLHYNGESYNYIPVDGDTVFELSDSKLIPKWYVFLGKDNPKRKDQVGEIGFSYLFESPRFFAGSLYTIESMRVEKTNGGITSYSTGKRETLFYDKNSEKIYISEKISNDFCGGNIDSYSVGVQSNKIIWVSLSAIDLIELSENLVENEVTNRIGQNLNSIIQEISPEDNPILLIGKLKK